MRTIVSSGGFWNTFRVEQMESGPSESVGYAVRSHVVAVNLGDALDLEMSWGGAPWQTYRVPRRAVQVVPADVARSVRWHKECEWIAILLAPSLVDRAAGALRRVELRPAFGVDEPVLAELLLALREDAGAANAAGQLYAEALAAAIAAQLVRKHTEALLREESAFPIALRDSPGTVPGNRLWRVCEHIATFLEGPISLANLAGIAGVSVSRFAHVFKQGTGLAPHQYVLAARVDRAKSLLHEPDLTIAEVAQRCGFGDQSHLTNAFRRRVGTSPQAYRRTLSPALRGSQARSDSD